MSKALGNLLEVLYENGSVKGEVRKVEEKSTYLDETSVGFATTQVDKKKAMQWDKATSQLREPIFEFNLAPSQSANNQEEAEGGPIIDPSPMTMTFNPKVEWVIEKLGPKSGHWKRFAREVKSKTA